MSKRARPKSNQALYLKDHITGRYRRATYGDLVRIFRPGTVPGTDDARTAIPVDSPYLDVISKSLGFHYVQHEIRTEKTR